MGAFLLVCRTTANLATEEFRPTIFRSNTITALVGMLESSQDTIMHRSANALAVLGKYGEFHPDLFRAPPLTSYSDCAVIAKAVAQSSKVIPAIVKLCSSSQNEAAVIVLENLVHHGLFLSGCIIFSTQLILF